VNFQNFNTQVPKIWNEGRHIAFCFLTVLTVGIIVIPASFVTSSVTSWYLLISLAIITGLLQIMKWI
jgi:hypothetical protein